LGWFGGLEEDSNNGTDGVGETLLSWCTRFGEARGDAQGEKNHWGKKKAVQRKKAAHKERGGARYVD